MSEKNHDNLAGKHEDLLKDIKEWRDDHLKAHSRGLITGITLATFVVMIFEHILKLIGK
jgi:hypothetical protein